jgi:hypothetical protein
VSRDFLLLVFFHKSVSPQPQSIPLGLFRIFSKILGDIRKSRCTTSINDTGGKFATGVNNTGCKIVAGINDTGGKFCHRYQQYRRQILPPVSLVLLIPLANMPLVSTTPAANLPPVSTIPAANFSTSLTSVVDTGGKYATGVNDIGGKFGAGVNDTGGKLPPVSLIPVAINGNNIRLQKP